MKSTINKFLTPLSLIGIFVAAFFLPLKTSLSNFGLILFIVSTILSLVVNGVERACGKNKQIYFTLPWILFLPMVVGLVYSPWQNEAFEELLRSVFLLVVPLVVFQKNRPSGKFHKYAKLGIISGVVVNSILLLGINFYDFFTGNHSFRDLFSFWFTSHSFIEPLGEDMHTIYLGSYYIIALAFLAFEKIGIPKTLKAVAVVLIVLSIVFLNSRITYLSVVLLGILFALEKLPWRVFALSLTSLLVILAISFPFFQKTYVFNKLINGTIWDLTKNIGTHNTSVSQRADSRMARWLVALELIEEKPIFGHGTGTEDQLLDKKYREYNMKNSIAQGYNSHNQFLSYLIKFGVFGTIFLLVYLLSNFYFAIKRHDLSYIVYLLMLGSIFLIENYLDRNMGISLVALFGTLFLLRNAGKNQDIKD